MTLTVRKRGKGKRRAPCQYQAHQEPTRNPLEDPRIRAQLQWAIIREHKRQTRETPWNTNWGNIPRENSTGVRVTLEFLPQVNLAHECVPGVPTVQTLSLSLSEAQTRTQQSWRHKDKAPRFLFLFDIHSNTFTVPCFHLILVGIIK